MPIPIVAVRHKCDRSIPIRMRIPNGLHWLNSSPAILTLPKWSNIITAVIISHFFYSIWMCLTKATMHWKMNYSNEAHHNTNTFYYANVSENFKWIKWLHLLLVLIEIPLFKKRRQNCFVSCFLVNSHQCILRTQLFHHFIVDLPRGWTQITFV